MPGPDQTLVIAHRGAWGDGLGANDGTGRRVAENSAEAFEAAIALGADMIELDVRRTRDGRLIAYHDARRAWNRTGALRHDELTVKRGPSPPPLLEDVLALAKGRIAVDIDLKERGYVSQVAALLMDFGPHRCLISSFLDDVVVEAKRSAPELSAALLIAPGAYRWPIVRAARAGADYVGIGRRLAHAALLRRAMQARIPCLIWGVNDIPGADRFLEHDAVRGIISDRPGVVLERRARLALEVSASLSDQTAFAGQR